MKMHQGRKRFNINKLEIFNSAFQILKLAGGGHILYIDDIVGKAISIEHDAETKAKGHKFKSM